MTILHRKTPITDKAEYIRLAKQYHPDNGGTDEEMAHINLLYSSSYVPPNQIKIGNIVYSYENNSIPSVLVGKNSILFQNLSPTPPTPIVFDFPNTKVKEEITKYLPVFVKRSDDFDIVGKSKSLFYLPLHLPKIIGTPHASWIVSSLYNFLCYLEWSGLTHNAIQIENLAIDPAAHSAHLLGGWRYSVPTGKRLSFLPRLAPVPKDKLATHRTDLAMLKALGLQLLGDRTGMGLDQTDPKVRFLRSVSSGSAITDYALWVKSLGVRKFVELKLE